MSILTTCEIGLQVISNETARFSKRVNKYVIDISIETGINKHIIGVSMYVRTIKCQY